MRRKDILGVDPLRDAIGQIRRNPRDVLLERLVHIGALHDELLEVLVEDVANNLDRKIRFSVEHGRRLASLHLRLDVVPLRLQA